jgi:PDZ domain-containing secreted protein
LIKDFIDRSRNGKYEGIPSVYFNAKATINPFERTQFGVPEQVSDGFMITSIDAISPFSGQLEENDLVTKMNGMSINYKAEVNHPVWEKITVTYFLKRLRIGDSVEIEGYRKGEKFKLSVKLDKKYDSQKFLVPPYFDDLNANYAVAGGLVFHNLSEDFLENWGANWKESAPVDLVVQAAYRQEFIPNKGEEKIVVLSHVLPMEFNKGYHGVNNYILESVNGTPVQSVGELVRVLNSEKKTDSEYLVFKFKAEGLKIVLYKKELSELRAKVIDKFGIPESAQVL